MYRGEVSISADRLLSFLHTTEALKIRGELIMHLSAWRVLIKNFFVGLADKQKSYSPIQPTNINASQVIRASRQHETPYPLPTPSPELWGRSTSTLGEDMVGMPEIQEFQPILLPVITPIATIEEIEEILDQQELAPLPAIAYFSTVEEAEEMSKEQDIKQTTTAVPTSINAASEALHMGTDDQTAPNLKREEPDIDISAKPFDEDLDLGEYLLCQMEVKMLS